MFSKCASRLLVCAFLYTVCTIDFNSARKKPFGELFWKFLKYKEDSYFYRNSYIREGVKPETPDTRRIQRQNTQLKKAERNWRTKRLQILKRTGLLSHLLNNTEYRDLTSRLNKARIAMRSVRKAFLDEAKSYNRSREIAIRMSELIKLHHLNETKIINEQIAIENELWLSEKYKKQEQQ